MQRQEHKDLYRRWTRDAVSCYSRKCRCEGCGMQEFCKNPIQNNTYNIPAMKYSVLRLFAQHGEPNFFEKTTHK